MSEARFVANCPACDAGCCGIHWSDAAVEAAASRFMSFLPNNNRANTDEDRYAAREILKAAAGVVERRDPTDRREDGNASTGGGGYGDRRKVRRRAVDRGERRDPPDLMEMFCRHVQQKGMDDTMAKILVFLQTRIPGVRGTGAEPTAAPCEMNARCLGCQRSIVGCVQDSTCATRADCALKGYERALRGALRAGGPPEEEGT